MRFQGARLCAIACVVLGGLAQPAFAAEEGAPSGPKLGFLISGDAEFGGDDIFTVNFTDGSDQDVKVGQGVSINAGLYFKPQRSGPFSVRGTLGYKFVTTAASNADIHLDRTVLELVGDYEWASGFFVGAGVVRHNGIKLSADGFGPDLDFEDATGLTFELGWKWFSLSYTDIEYEDEFGDKWDAGNIGLSMAYRF